MLKRGLKCLALGMSLCLARGAVLAQEFLSRPVRIVVPQTPGGASDALARIVAQKLSEKWQQSIGRNFPLVVSTNRCAVELGESHLIAQLLIAAIEIHST
jgi:hypothetical protein